MCKTYTKYGIFHYCQFFVNFFFKKKGPFGTRRQLAEIIRFQANSGT